jgi:hypothetical protein
VISRRHEGLYHRGHEVYAVKWTLCAKGSSEGLARASLILANYPSCLLSERKISNDTGDTSVPTYTPYSSFFPEGEVGLVPKRGCLLYVRILRIPRI